MAGAALDAGSASAVAAGDVSLSLSLAGAGAAGCVLAGAVLAGAAFGRPFTLCAEPDAAASTTAPRIKRTSRFGIIRIVPKNLRLARTFLRRFLTYLRGGAAQFANDGRRQCARQTYARAPR